MSDPKNKNPQEPTNGELQHTNQQSIFGCIYEIFRDSLPLTLAFLGNAIKPTFTLIAVNKSARDEATFAAIGLGTAIMNVFVRCVITGFNHSTVTYLSQAYGAKEYRQLGDIMNKIRVLYTIWILPITAMLCFCGHLLYALGQPYDLAFNTQYFIRLSVISFFGQLHYDINRRYLSAIGMRSIQAYIPYITLVFHVLWCYIFLNYLDLKIEGAAIVQILQFWMNYIILEIIIRCSEAKKHIHGFTTDCLKGWWIMIWDGVPSVLYEIITRTCYEASTFVAGFISIELVMINSAYLNIFWLFYVMTTGVQYTSSCLMGNKIGAGDIIGTKRYIRANIVFAVFYGLLVVAILHSFPDYILSNYTKNEDTLQIMKHMLPAFSITIWLMIIKDIMFGVIIGLGLQASTTNLTIYLNLIIWSCLIYSFTFLLGFSYTGPWYSMSIVVSISIFYIYRLINQTNVEDIIKKSVEKRVKLKTT